MKIEEWDEYVQNLLLTQQEMITLNKASTMIREVLPRASATVRALDEEILRRFRVIQDIRAILALEGVINAG